MIKLQVFAILCLYAIIASAKLWTFNDIENARNTLYDPVAIKNRGFKDAIEDLLQFSSAQFDSMSTRRDSILEDREFVEEEIYKYWFEYHIIAPADPKPAGADLHDVSFYYTPMWKLIYEYVRKISTERNKSKAKKMIYELTIQMLPVINTSLRYTTSYLEGQDKKIEREYNSLRPFYKHCRLQNLSLVSCIAAIPDETLRKQHQNRIYTLKSATIQTDYWKKVEGKLRLLRLHELDTVERFIRDNALVHASNEAYVLGQNVYFRDYTAGFGGMLDCVSFYSKLLKLVEGNESFIKAIAKGIDDAAVVGYIPLVSPEVTPEMTPFKLYYLMDRARLKHIDRKIHYNPRVKVATEAWYLTQAAIDERFLQAVWDTVRLTQNALKFDLDLWHPPADTIDEVSEVSDIDNYDTAQEYDFHTADEIQPDLPDSDEVTFAIDDDIDEEVQNSDESDGESKLNADNVKLVGRHDLLPEHPRVQKKKIAWYRKQKTKQQPTPSKIDACDLIGSHASKQFSSNFFHEFIPGYMPNNQALKRDVIQPRSVPLTISDGDMALICLILEVGQKGTGKAALKWNEAEALIIRLGGYVKPTHGSVYTVYIPTGRMNLRPRNLHKPHPGNRLGNSGAKLLARAFETWGITGKVFDAARAAN